MKTDREMAVGPLVVTFPVSERTRATANCRRALLGETPLHLAREEERMR